MIRAYMICSALMCVGLQAQPDEPWLKNAKPVTRTGVSVTVPTTNESSAATASPVSTIKACRFGMHRRIGDKPMVRRMITGSLTFGLDGKTCTATWLEAETDQPIEPQFPISGVSRETNTTYEPLAPVTTESVQPLSMYWAKHSVTTWLTDPIGLIVNSAQSIVEYNWYTDGHLQPLSTQSKTEWLSASGWTRTYWHAPTTFDPYCQTLSKATNAKFENPTFCLGYTTHANHYNIVTGYVGGDYDYEAYVTLDGGCAALLTVNESDW